MTNDVLFEEVQGNGGNLGVITLNRADALNALNHAMVQAMTAQLQRWEAETAIKAVVIRGHGRAFCAGGDLRHTHVSFKSAEAVMAPFFHDEYHLNRLIFHYPKPYIALLDGITMGGGVGISIHGSHRIATEKCMFAMPETGIGFFPDVGGTYFLPRLSGYVGNYLGLTGARLNADDCTTLGITTQKIASASLPAVLEALLETPFTTNAKQNVTDILSRFAAPIESSELLKQEDLINHCFNATKVEDIIARLETSATPFAQTTLSHLAKKSPTSLKVTLRALQEGKTMEFDACMRQEYRLVCRFLHGHDFSEGIRAVIIDKDQSPKWQPSTLSEVTDSEVDSYFIPLTEELL